MTGIRGLVDRLRSKLGPEPTPEYALVSIGCRCRAGHPAPPSSGTRGDSPGWSIAPSPSRLPSWPKP